MVLKQNGKDRALKNYRTNPVFPGLDVKDIETNEAPHFGIWGKSKIFLLRKIREK